MDLMPILAALKRQKTAAALIAIEIALCCAIVCNALFLIENRLERSATASGVAEMELVRIATAGTGDDDATARLRADLAAIRDISGVVSATLTNQVPFGNSSWNTSVRLAQDDKNSVADVGAYYGDEQLLETLGVNLVAGRDFNADEFVDFDALIGDKAKDPTVVIITSTLAKKLYGDADPLGREFYPSDTAVKVVGVVDRLIRPRLGEDAAYTESSMILPIRMGGGYGFFLLRAKPQDRAVVIEAVRAKLKEISPNRIVFKTDTVEELRKAYFKQDRVMAGLLVAVVVSLLIVTALGIVGLASFWVQRRRRQIGIRRALGATRRQILQYFQTENFLIVTLGIALGMAGAYAISGWLMQQYEMPRLPLWYLPVGAVVLWLLGQIAVLAPALRAASVPPATATRSG